MKITEKDKKKAIELLNSKDLHVTQDRICLLALLMNQHAPVTAKDIHKISGKVCDLATVHRNIGSLLGVNLIHATSFKDHSKWYELWDGDQHMHHLFCTRCEKIEKIPCTHLMDYKRVISKSKGFSVESHSLEFFGICRSCKQKSNPIKK